MNDFMQKSISGSIGDVMRQIVGVDDSLAGIFGVLGDIFADEERRRKDSDGKIRNKDTVERITDKISRDRGAINTFPFGEPCGCLEECWAVTLGTLNSKYGFNKIIEKVKNYWFSCSENNYLTVIITNAWDITDFNSRHKNAFDSYTSSNNKDNRKHIVVIISYGDYGTSLQYLR